MTKANNTAVPLFIALAVAISGCNDDGLDKVVVRGNVSYDGKPVPNGQIRFIPIEGTSGPVSGGVIKDGKYTASGKGGVPLGKHRVEIYAYRPASGVTNHALSEEGGPSEQYIPEEYNGLTTLQVEISDNPESHIIDFDLDADA